MFIIIVFMAFLGVSYSWLARALSINDSMSGRHFNIVMAGTDYTRPIVGLQLIA